MLCKCAGSLISLEVLLQTYYSKGICATASTAQDGDHLSVHYTGRFDNENGKIFDTSHNSGQLYKFQLGARQVS
jgi:FKBP-type peptidyl-prolyl cis-trans isomerase